MAGLYADFLDGWLVDDADKELADAPGRLRVVARPLWMHDVPSTADIAGAALDLGRSACATTPYDAVRRRRRHSGHPHPPAGHARGAPGRRPRRAGAATPWPRTGSGSRDGDVLVVSSKVASKALGLTAAAQDRAEAVLRQSRRVVAERDTPLGVTRVVEAVAGPVMAAAGVDASNTGAADVVLLLPGRPRRGGPRAAGADRRAAARGGGRRHPQRHGGPALAGRADRLRARRGRRSSWSTTCAAARTATGAR